MVGLFKKPTYEETQLGVFHIDTLLPEIHTCLFEHYEPYRDAASCEELPDGDEPFPLIDSAADVSPHVYLQWIDIGPLEGSPSDGPVIEVAYRVAWDEEHTVGVRIQDGRVFELCGSTL